MEGASPMIHQASPYLLCRCGQVHRPQVVPTLARLLRPYDGFLIAVTEKDAMLQKLATDSTHISVHTAYSSTGANEVSPVTRFAATWGTAGSGSIALAATLPSFSIPASTPEVSWWSGWSALTSGTFRFIAPLGGGTIRPASAEIATDITNNDIYAKAHGYAAADRVVGWGTLPTGLTVGVLYFVIATGLTADIFRVSTTLGGSAVDLTGTPPFNFFVQKCAPEAFVSAGTLTFGATSLDLAGII